MSPFLRSILTAPALRAGLAQLCAFPVTVLLVYALARAGLAPGYGVAAVVQGVVAALLGARVRLAPWWLPIQLLFPLLIYGAAVLALRPAFYLGGFLFLLLLFWSTFRTQVPYYPSGRRVWEAVAAQLPPGRPLAIADIGCGLGGMVLHLARARPDCAVTGIELAPLPWLVCRLRALGARGHLKFLRGDYHDLHFGGFDVVFAYLSPAAMPALWDQARAELRPGSVLMSFEFEIPGHPPNVSVTPTGHGPAIFLWHF